MSSIDEAEARGDCGTLRGADPHLRSFVEVTGYRVDALDGEIGHIDNLMIDDADWSVHYLIVDTRNWWFGKHVLISPIAVKSVDWFDRHVELDMPGEQVRASPPWNPLNTFSQVYAKELHNTTVGRDPPASWSYFCDDVLWPGSPRSVGIVRPNGQRAGIPPRCR